MTTRLIVNTNAMQVWSERNRSLHAITLAQLDWIMQNAVLVEVDWREPYILTITIYVEV